MSQFRTIHPFPARMAPDLAWEELPDRQTPLRVLDPMAGSGTTLVAARMRGHHAVGFDRDPLAILMANAWVSNFDCDQLREAAVRLLSESKSEFHHLNRESAYPEGADEETKKFISFWFDDINRLQLTSLSLNIQKEIDPSIRNLLWCALSRMIITKKAGVSLAMDVSHSRPHKTYEQAPHRAFDRFIFTVDQIIKSSPFAGESRNLPPARVVAADAREMPLKDRCIDTIITSPPYLNAIDYLRGHKLSLVWMGHHISELRNLRASNVGTERSNVGKPPEAPTKIDAELAEILKRICSDDCLSSRNSAMLARYLTDLYSIMNECFRVLKRGGKAVFVVGDCNIKQTFVSNSLAVEMISLLAGFEIKSIRRRPLPDNRRYLPPPKTKSSGAALQKRMREEVVVTALK